MSNHLRNKRKMQLMILGSFALVLILLIINVVFMFKLGSLQKQVNELKEARIKKTQMQLANANAAGKDNNKNETSRDSTQTETPEATDVPATQQPKESPTANPNEKVVYLTFDDGPSKNTERILAVLDQYKVKATFFVNGREDADSIARYKKIAEAGHEIAMHSYSHDYADIYANTANFESDLDRIQSLIERITGKKPMVYRFPGGSSNGLSVRQLPMQSFADVLSYRGVVYFDWNVDTTDGEGPNRPVETLIAQADKDLGRKPQSVILMHDAGDHDTTVDALPGIIQTCIDKGLKFDVITADTPPIHHTLAK